MLCKKKFKYQYISDMHYSIYIIYKVCTVAHLVLAVGR